MAKVCRHLKALNRKNLIVYRRTPICAIFELVLPCALMCLMVWLRTMVHIKQTDLSSLEKYKHPVFPGLTYSELTSWGWDPDAVTDFEQSFMNFVDYHPVPPVHPGKSGAQSHPNTNDSSIEVNQEKNKNYKTSTEDLSNQTQNEERDELVHLRNLQAANNDTTDQYDIKKDWMGPLYFMPNQCIRQTSWTHPHKTSPLIVMIDHQNDVQEGIYKYYKTLTKKILKIVSIAFAPAYQMEVMSSKEELFDYLQSDDYMVDRKAKGVCFAFEVVKNADNDYSMNLYYGDHSFPGAHFANGIPLQSNPVVNPTRMAPDMNSFEQYSRRGYAYLHNLMANQVLKEVTGDPDANISFMTSPVPGAVNVQDDFQAALAGLLPLFILIAYIPMVYNMVFRIVCEKESRAKEVMRIMGMTDLPYWMSWFIFYTVINTVVSTLCWGILLTKVINYSHSGYIWLFFWLYGEAVFGQIIFLQSMFTGSKYAGIVSTIIYFCGVLVDKVITGDGITRLSKLLASLLPQVALMQGSVVFANYEGTGVGLNSSTSAVIFQEYSFNSALWMLTFDFFLYFTLGLYMDKIIPSDYGQRLSPWFLCTPSYYRCCRRTRRRGPAAASDGASELVENDIFESAQMPGDNYEAPPVICKRLEASNEYLRIENLQKVFSGGFRAVQGVNVKMYDSQIFALLGHNGAGKTTLISMLTGLIQKSQGEAKVYDVDMFEEMDEVREFMGVCPQHDVLFDLLTPREHLDIFYDFKGGDPARKQQEIDSLIVDVGLTIDQMKQAKTLSGGNKRKLSVSIALCGGSKLVLLDEPTSGMDLGARRNLWDMLKSYKKDRIIILTTHYMDEADVLGDRIGIMCKGTLQCLGSSLFLKNRFGLGYRITFVKKRRKAHPGLEKFMQSYFKGVEKAGEVVEEISFVIPKTESQNFGGFFQALDEQLEDYDIRSYGVSMSNLEDVFLKINQEFAPDLFGDLKNFSADNSKNSSGEIMDSQYGSGHRDGTIAKSIAHSSDYRSSLKNSTKNRVSSGRDEFQKNEDSNCSSDDSNEYEVDLDQAEGNLIRGSSCVRSCTASSAKRFIIYKRDWCGLLCQIVIPITLVLFGLWITSGPSKLTQSPPRHLSTGWYPAKQRLLMNQNPVDMVGDGFDVQGSELFANLPNSTQAFEVEYIEANNYIDFYNQVYEARNDLPLYPYRYGSYQIYHANKKSSLYQIVNYLNVTSQDVTAMYPQYMYQAILRVATDDPNFTFDVTSTPYPIYQAFKDIEEAASAYDFVFMTAIALALIPCVMVQFILMERELQVKHQQLLSGMSLAGYWSSNIIFDIVMAYIPIGLIIMLTFVFNKHYEGIWLLFLLYPPAVVPFTYVTSFLFKSDINAQITTLFLHFVSGGLLVIVVFVLQYLPVTMKAGDALRWACMVFPSFCVAHGILFSASGTLLVQSRAETVTDDGQVIPRKIPPEIWDWYNLKGDCVVLVCHFILGIFLLTLIELEIDQYFSWCPKIGCKSSKSNRQGPPMIKDDDVIAEERRVAMQVTRHGGSVASSQVDPALRNTDVLDSMLSGLKVAADPTHLDCIRVHNFQKEYDTFCGAPVRAVKQASFGLDYGECFALLGVNGAGKSTTFKSLTRDTIPTAGEITINGFDIQKQFQDARKLIGYCPQYDAIFPKMTVEETIKFYALIKGIRTHKIKSVTEKAIRDLNLKDHRNKLAGTLSGGNKRKLSVAMALIGNPPIILLDEPSAGMDPEARRFMWQVVEKISQRDKKSAVILTTHSMEEAEALSTKLGIMVRGGVFRCMGSSQHIKNKFGVGYEVEIKVVKSHYHNLEEMANQIGFNVPSLQTKINLQTAINQCQGANFDQNILSQIRDDGIGHDLVTEASIDGNGEVRLVNLLEFLKAQTYGFRILTFLTRHFQQVEILEQCGEFFKLRVPKEGKTIGWLFGQFEQERKDLGIQEYSVSQTTLEQIFQNFANQSIASDKAAFTFRPNGESISLMNPDRRMTEDQERLSQRGLSFATDQDSKKASRIEVNRQDQEAAIEEDQLENQKLIGQQLE